jgi:hypothetical protein
VTDHVHLDPRDAANIADYLYGLANLIDPEMDSPGQLIEVQRRLLTNPPGRAISANPDHMANLLRDHVATIRG